VQVVLLAAGLGSRLGALTERLPKALVSVAGDPLIAHAIRFAQRTSPREIVVVGGFRFDLLAAELAGRAAPVTLIENPSFRDGNLVSLFAARPRVDEDFLLMNVDHIYRPAIAALAAAPIAGVTAFIDTDRSLGTDDMKVQRDGAGCVGRIAKTLTSFDCGYVGMTRVPAADLDRYWDAAAAVLTSDGRAVHVERVLARLAESDRPPACRDISGHGWLEVDTADERDAAERSLRAWDESS